MAKKTVAYYTPEMPNSDIWVPLEFLYRDSGGRYYRPGDLEESQSFVERAVKKGHILALATETPIFEDTTKVLWLTPEGDIFFADKENPQEDPNKIAAGSLTPEYMLAVFENPTLPWSHTGSFSVQLTDDADTVRVRVAYVKLSGAVITADDGTIKQTDNGFCFTAGDYHFSWSNRFIECIHDGTGKLLWVNDDYREGISG